jgi:PEP-CTERM motif
MISKFGRRIFLFGGAIALALGLATNAHAVITTSTYTQTFDADGGNNWGIPGVGSGVVPYLGLVPAYGFQVSFTGTGTIDANSILIGNSAGCVGSSGGGTTFCTINPTDPWEAFQRSPHSIEFLAQNPTFYLSPGQDFFVNVFFNGDPPSSSFNFITTFSPTPGVPEPSTWAMIVLGFLGLGWLARRRVNAPCFG